MAQENAAGRRLHLPRGRVLGGSHALNAVIWVRGTHADYDGWEAQGANGWGWKAVEPYFVRAENYRGPLVAGGDERGTHGPLDVTADYQLDPIQASIVEAANKAGINTNPDYNSGEIEGISKMQVNMRSGRRFNTWMAYCEPILENHNFTVITGAHASRVLLREGCAEGVEYLRQSELHQVMADRVVLCGGSLDSPRLLMRSRIGPRPHLEEMGIEVKVDLPGVGENLHDHYLVPVIAEATKRQIDAPRDGVSVAQTHLFASSPAADENPDTQPINFSVPMYQTGMTGPANAFTLQAGLVATKSRGRLRLSGPNLTDPPLIDLAALADKRDEDALLYSLRQCRDIVCQPALREAWGAVEIYPGPQVETEEQERDYIRSAVVTYHHQVGTCRMGTDAGAVVDPTLKVHQVSALFVIDASVMPTVPSGNTNAPAIMIGERGAEFVLADLQPSTT